MHMEPFDLENCTQKVKVQAKKRLGTQGDHYSHTHLLLKMQIQSKFTKI